jgi:hypothetical protein
VAKERRKREIEKIFLPQQQERERMIGKRSTSSKKCRDKNMSHNFKDKILR